MTYRDTALDQALDIAGSRNKSQTYNLSQEPNSLGSPVPGQLGSSAILSSATYGLVTLNGLTGMSLNSVGRFITLSGAAVPGNNGTFLITSYISASSVNIINASGALDTNSGSISWVERLPYSLQDDLNYARTDRAAIKGTNYYDSVPTYVRPEATNVNIPANLANIAGKTTDAKALVNNRKFENVFVALGSNFVTLTDAGNLKHADAINTTGIPIWDGYDAGNWNSTYVEISSSLETELIAQGGLPDGYRIFGRARAGSGVSPNSFEVEFRAVPLGGSIVNSIAYTWDGYQPSYIDVFYPYRETIASMDENALRVLLINGLVGDTGGGGGGGGGIDPTAHELLDTLVHNIAEDGYSTVTYNANKITNYTIYTDSSMLTKIREYQLSYDIDPCHTRVSQVYIVQYNALGSPVSTLTETFNYFGNKIIGISSVKT